MKDGSDSKWVRFIGIVLAALLFIAISLLIPDCPHLGTH
jgi:hypothetical protein